MGVAVVGDDRLGSGKDLAGGVEDLYLPARLLNVDFLELLERVLGAGEGDLINAAGLSAAQEVERGAGGLDGASCADQLGDFQVLGFDGDRRGSAGLEADQIAAMFIRRDQADGQLLRAEIFVGRGIDVHLSLLQGVAGAIGGTGDLHGRIDAEQMHLGLGIDREIDPVTLRVDHGRADAGQDDQERPTDGDRAASEARPAAKAIAVDLAGEAQASRILQLPHDQPEGLVLCVDSDLRQGRIVQQIVRRGQQRGPGLAKQFGVNCLGRGVFEMHRDQRRPQRAIMNQPAEQGLEAGLGVGVFGHRQHLVNRGDFPGAAIDQLVDRVLALPPRAGFHFMQQGKFAAAQRRLGGRGSGLTQSGPTEQHRRRYAQCKCENG